MKPIVGNRPKVEGRYMVWIVRYDYERTPVRKFPIESFLDFYDGEWWYVDSNRTVKQRAIIGAFAGPLPAVEVVNGECRFAGEDDDFAAPKPSDDDLFE